MKVDLYKNFSEYFSTFLTAQRSYIGAPPYFPPFLHRGNKFGDFLFASLENVALYEQILYYTQNKRKELASSGAKSHKSRPPFGKASKQEAMKVVPL